MTLVQIALLFFIAGVLVILTFYLWYVVAINSPKAEMRRRLRRMAIDTGDRRFPEELRVEILQEMTYLDKALYSLKAIKALDVMIDRSGIRIDVKMFLAIIIASSATGVAVGMLLNRGLGLTGLLAVLFGIAPFFWLRIMRERRMVNFTEQFPNALDMISRSLKAGHSFSTVFQMIGTEMPEPVAGIFKTAFEEQLMGVSTRESVSNMADRINSMDLKFFVMALTLNREIGGNLGEILDRLAKTIRERITIRRQVRVYTAQARLSGYILAVVPIVMGFFFYVSSPGYIEELFDSEAGRYAMAGAVAAQIAGFLVIRRIVNIRI